MDDTTKPGKQGKKKDHRVSFSIGAFNDGLRTTLSKSFPLVILSVAYKRLFTQTDETTFGINKNSMDQLRTYFTHT